jgi:hypothetical protein
MNDDVVVVAKRLLLGKGIIEATKFSDSSNLKLWMKKVSRKDKKQLMKLAKYLVLDRHVKCRFSSIDLPGDEYDFSVLEIIHLCNAEADASLLRFNELKEVVGL